MGGLLVAGTSSDAGKSLVTTGLCRAYARRGLRVAPFKAQNMSNNSMVCADGSEIGRAQYLQAQAAGVEPSSLHNPVLLKPGSDRRSHVVLRGRPAGELRAGEYATGRAHLAQAATAACAELLATHDLVLAEGAGSPAEINLRAGDYVNMGLARRFNLPVLLVGDIDRGGVLASVYGTWALLDDADRTLLRAWAVNRFRGDESVLAPGLSMIEERTGLPCVGVLPWLQDVWLDSEDALSLGRWHHAATPDEQTLRLAVIRLPRTSNATDVDALAAEPGVEVRVTTDPSVCRDAHLLVLPGSRATVSDLAWLRERGLADVVLERVAAQRPVLGICGGYQMLLDAIVDEGIEHRSGSDGGGPGTVPGLGALPFTVRFGADKVLRRPEGSWRGVPVSGYEIHHGVVDDDGSFPGGAQVGTTWGTIWHGTLEGDAFRRAWLAEVAAASGSGWRAQAGAPAFADLREGMIDRLADAVTEHLDLDRLLELAQTARTEPRPLEETRRERALPHAGEPEGQADPPPPGAAAHGPRPVRLIGIGAGHPGHLTEGARRALQEVSVVLVADKGERVDELRALREGLVRRINPSARVIAVPDPRRGDDATRQGAAYTEGVRDWHAARAHAYAEVIAGLPEGEAVGLLVWGDPAFYDSTIRVIDDVAARLPLQVEVLPGITAFQALAAAHGIVLHEVGQPVHITTGRRLVEEWRPDLGTVVVMLDGRLACRDLLALAAGQGVDLQIWWGACLGLPQQELRSGRLAEVIDDITATRAALREQHGWVMDVYALRPTTRGSRTLSEPSA